jgi:hypothetical protein
MQTRPENIDILEEHLQDVLTHAATFRQWLHDGPETALVQEEYDGMRNHLARLTRSLVLEARRLGEQCVQLRDELDEQRESSDAECDRLERRCAQLARRSS